VEGNKTVSILMGIYNCASTLPRAIESILAQTYGQWELILCDDASTDDTYAVALQYAQRYPEKIVLLKNETHSYLAYSLNRCLAAAKGELVARMDGDDISCPDRLQKQVAFLHEHPEVVLVGTAMRRMIDGKEYGVPICCPSRPDRFSPRSSTVFNHATIMAYKHVYDALGGYTVLPRTERGQDLDLWFRFLHAGYCGANMDDVLYIVCEDAQTLKRRTLRNRWRVFQTTMYGYRLLSYPWHWYFRPFFGLCKALVPDRLVLWYRKRQR